MMMSYPSVQYHRDDDDDDLRAALADARDAAQAIMPVIISVFKEARRRGDTVAQQERDIANMIDQMRARLSRSFPPQLVDALIKETWAAYRASAEVLARQ